MMFCRLYQWRIERQIDDHDRVKHPQLLRHLETCTSCQNWLDSLKQIGLRLQSDSTDISDLQIEQIQASVGRYLADAAEPVASIHKMYTPRRLRYAISAAAAVIAIAIGIFSLHLHQSDSSDNNGMLDSVAQLSGQLQYQIPALASLPDQLIESEIQNMETGVRHAIVFIKNCLPQGFIAAQPPSENIDSL
jgi:hypothetical protein